jgi:hypothetical protein
MEFIDSVIFLFFLLIYLSTLKGNTLFFIFGAAIYLFFIFQLFFLDPIGILTLVTNSIFSNPIVFFLLCIPLIIDIIYRRIKKFKRFKQNYH